jgi:soluble lytic murein transglycosylase
LVRLALEDQRYGEALDRLNLLAGLGAAQLPSGVTREEIAYWKGHCEGQLGRTGQSSASYLEAARGRPNYFSYLAREGLDPPIQGAPSAKQNWERLIVARPWLAGDTPPPPAAQLDAPARLRELLFLRLYEEAYEELKACGAARLSLDRPGYFFNLAVLAERAQLWRDSIRAAERAAELLDMRTAPDLCPPPLRKLVYPVRHWDLIERYGRSYGVDPFLLLAVMREESQFQSDARSSASARGLMQIMPATARILAPKLGVRLRGLADLNQPSISVQLGSYYLSQMLRQFNNQWEKALAAYNGGPGSVGRWEKRLVRDTPPIFVASIGFRETKLYVLKVIGGYHAYRSIYGAALAPAEP